jgi:hypothetical protein
MNFLLHPAPRWADESRVNVGELEKVGDLTYWSHEWNNPWCVPFLLFYHWFLYWLRGENSYHVSAACFIGEWKPSWATILPVIQWKHFGYLLPKWPSRVLWISCYQQYKSPGLVFFTTLCLLHFKSLSLPCLLSVLKHQCDKMVVLGKMNSLEWMNTL